MDDRDFDETLQSLFSETDDKFWEKIDGFFKEISDAIEEVKEATNKLQETASYALLNASTSVLIRRVSKNEHDVYNAKIADVRAAFEKLLDTAKADFSETCDKLFLDAPLYEKVSDETLS